MGVIINAPDPFIEYIEDALENLIDANFNEEPVVRYKQRKQKARSPAKPADIRLGNDNNSGRRKRRYDNVAFLLTLSEKQDFDEVSIYDFIPQTVSAFARLLVGKDTMKEFNNFINCTEDEQDQFFNGHPVQNQENYSNIAHDQRAVHPALNADESFQKLESRFKNLLKKHVPLGNVAYLEEKLVGFFKKWPRSVYVSELPNSFDRLILHALCQYLNLSSQSFNQKGLRQTRVKNLNDEFVLPSMTLSDYLEKRNHFSDY